MLVHVPRKVNTGPAIVYNKVTTKFIYLLFLTFLKDILAEYYIHIGAVQPTELCARGSDAGSG